MENTSNWISLVLSCSKSKQYVPEVKLYGKKRIPLVNVKQFNSVHARRLRYYHYAHKIPDRGYDIIPQSMDPIRCTYWQSSSLMFQITLKKQSSALCSNLECSSPHRRYRDLTQLHPHLSNPNEWQLHLSILRSTSVHPTWRIILRTSRRVHPNYAVFLCLHGHQSKTRIAPQTLLVGWLVGCLDPQCSCKVFLVQLPYFGKHVYYIQLISS